MIDLLAVGLALCGAISLAGAALFVRLGTNEGNANEAIVVALFINLVIFVAAAGITTPSSYRPSIRAVLAFTAAGLVAPLIGRTLYYRGISRVGASRSEPIKASTPLHATILAVLVLGESLTSAHLFGILAIVGGVALISYESSRRSSLGGEDFPVIALWLPLAAAVAFGIEPIFVKIGFADGTALFVALTIKTVVAFLGFTLYLRWRGVFPRFRSIPRRTMRWYLLAGIANSLFHIAYYLALIVAPVVLVVPIIQMSPLLVALFAFVFLQRLERVTPRLVIGAGIVVLGGILVSIHG